MEIETASRSLKDGATPPVPVVSELGVELEGLPRVKPPVPGGHTEDLTHPIQVPQAHHQLPDYGVEARAESPARDNGGPHLRGLEEHVLAGAGAVVSEEWGRSGEGPREVVGDLAENDVGSADVEAFHRVKVWILVQWVGPPLGLEVWVWDVVGEVGQILQVDGLEQVACVHFHAGIGGGFFQWKSHGGSGGGNLRQKQEQEQRQGQIQRQRDGRSVM